MATVAPASPDRTRYDAQLDAELGRTVGRIRANDLFVGGLAAAVLALAYTAGMVLLDRWLVLAMPVRQAALAGFVLSLGVVGWLLVVRPLRRAVNPRFAARRVEGTLPDAKNAVINWVDLRDRDLAPTVRAAVSRNAAGSLTAADVAKATEARPVAWLGAAAGLLAALLAVLFVVLKPAPFASLVGRTFNPFVVREIATRTTLTLTEPAGGDTTVTTGESLTVAVDVGGSVPDADGPDRLRLQVWHTAAAAEFDELPLEPGPDRDWRLTVPPSVVQNGFWYRVVGGDARTADHRVAVRSRPLVTGFEARYEAPAYTRIPPEVAREPRLEGYRGTKVTLLARTNRPLKRGAMKIGTRPEPVPATVVGESRDTMQFDLTLAESGSYRLEFTAADDEASEPTPPYPIKVLADQPPRLTITAPADDAVTLPANGTLAIDGEAADDFGLTAVTLRMRVVKPLPVTLQPKPYRGGKPLRRADGTFPTRLTDAEGSRTGYKETVDLAGLKQADGKPLPADPNTVIEYWLEATDNCAVPKPNVGVSAKKTLWLTPAVTDPPKKQELDEQARGRKADQQRHEQAQDKQLDTEPREPKQLRPDDKPPGGEQQPGEGQPQQGQPGGAPNPGEKQPKQPDDSQPPAGDQPTAGGESAGTQGGQPQPKDGGKPGDANKGTGETPPQQPGGATQEKPDGQPGTGGQPDPAKPSAPPQAKDAQKSQGGGATGSQEQRKLDEQASKLDQAIREQDRESEQAPQPRPADGQQPQASGGATGESSDLQKQHEEKQQAFDDLASDDPAKKQAARDKLDQMVGKDQRERAEKLTNNLKSNDPKVREQARKELGELDRETGTSGAGPRNDRKEDIERLSREAEELNSPDPAAKQNAEQRADKKYGRPDREQLQEAGRNLKSPDPAKQQEAKKDIDELAKKDKKKKEQPGGGDQPAGEQLKQQANDLNSPDPAKKQAAEQAMDQRMGEPARKDLQQKLGSDDPKQQEAGKQQVEQMTKPGGEAGKQPTAEQMKNLAETAKDLNSNDPEKRQAAEQKLDRQLGEAGRKQLQQDLKDLQSTDPQKKQAAGQKLKDAEKLAGDKTGAKPDQPKAPTQEQIDRAAETARDLTSTDPEKRKAAERKLDDRIGEERRKQLQQQLNDLKTGTPEQQAEAARKLQQTAKEEAAKAGQKPPTPEQAKELADAAKDLNNPDPAKRQTAEQKLDKAIGKAAREQLQKEQAAKQPDPKAARDATEKAMASDKGPKPDTAETERKMNELADTAKDLTSPDEAKKQAAEKKLDDQIGKEAREQLQQLSRDAQSPDEKTRKDAQAKIQELCGDCLKRSKNAGRGTGWTDDIPGKKYDDDPANRLKTAELQLKTFKDNKGNEAALKTTGYTPEEYERFLAEYEKRVAQLRQEAAKPGAVEQPKPAAGPPTVRVGEGSKGPLAKKGDGEATGGAGGGKAASGYEDAQRRFAAQAAKGKKPAEAPKP